MSELEQVNAEEIKGYLTELVESPLHFRIRKIFVLENFLSRV